MTRKNIAIAIGFALAACAHNPPPKETGRSLDDAELQKYRNEPTNQGIPGPGKVVTLGTGQVDLSNWKSSEKRAAEADAQAAGTNGEATSTTETTPQAGESPSGSAGANATNMNDSGTIAGASGPAPVADDVDFDAGITVEEDAVELIPADD